MIYLASPYNNGLKTDESRERNYQAVLFATWKLLSEGQFIYSPIVHCHDLNCTYDMPRNFEFWLAYNHDFIDAAGTVWVLCVPGWETSSGVRDEIDYALEKGYPLHYVHTHVRHFNGEKPDEIECFVRAHPPTA